MRTRRGKPFGYGLDLSAITPRLPPKSVVQGEAHVSLQDSPTLSSNESIEGEQDQAFLPNTRARLLVDYTRTEIQTVSDSNTASPSITDVISRFVSKSALTTRNSLI